MYDSAIVKVQGYIDEFLPELDSVYPTCIFDSRSYARWAANEILDRLMCEASKLPPHITGQEPRSVLDIIDEFISELDCYFYISRDGNTQAMVNIAEHTAKYIRRLFV